MSRKMIRSTFRVLIGVVALTPCGAGCRTATGARIHVTVPRRPKAGYKQPMISPTGKCSATAPPWRRAVRAGGAAEPGFELIDYRRLGGIVVWAEPAGGRHFAGRGITDWRDRRSQGAGRGRAPGKRRRAHRLRLPHVEDVAVLLRTQAGEVFEIQGADSSSAAGAGLVEVLREDATSRSRGLTSRRRRGPGGCGTRAGDVRALPPGSYRVATWHPICPPQQVVEVAAGPLVKLTLTVGVNALPKAGSGSGPTRVRDASSGGGRWRHAPRH